MDRGSAIRRLRGLAAEVCSPESGGRDDSPEPVDNLSPDCSPVDNCPPSASVLGALAGGVGSSAGSGAVPAGGSAVGFAPVGVASVSDPSVGVASGDVASGSEASGGVASAREVCGGVAVGGVRSAGGFAVDEPSVDELSVGVASVEPSGGGFASGVSRVLGVRRGVGVSEGACLAEGPAVPDGRRGAAVSSLGGSAPASWAGGGGTVSTHVPSCSFSWRRLRMSPSAYSNSGDQNSASNGHTSMQMPQYMQRAKSMAKRSRTLRWRGRPPSGAGSVSLWESM